MASREIMRHSCSGTQGLLLNGTRREARGHARLQRQEEEQGRQSHQRRPCHHVAPFDVLAEKRAEEQRHCLEVGLRQRSEREQVFRPAQQKRIGRGRDDPRQHDRKPSRIAASSRLRGTASR
jgi:hypothetical protein